MDCCGIYYIYLLMFLQLLLFCQHQIKVFNILACCWCVCFRFFHLAQSIVVLTFCSCWHGYRLCLNSEQSFFFPLHSHFHHSGFYQNISTPFVASCHSRHDKFFTINIHSSKSGRVVVIPPLTDVHSLNQRPRRHIVCHGDTFNN